MSIDFYYAFIIGWSILFFFWIVIVVFIYLRKPPKSKLTIKLIFKSLLLFGLCLMGILFFL